MEIRWFCTEIWRYIDFKMAAVHHLGIVLPPYETTHKVSVADRRCLSNFMSIWQTDLKIQLFDFFTYLAWNAYSGPQNVGFGELWTPKCDYSLSRSPKGTSLHKSASFKLSINCKNPLRGLTCWRVDRKCDGYTDSHTHPHTQVSKFIFSMHSIALDRTWQIINFVKQQKAHLNEVFAQTDNNAVIVAVQWPWPRYGWP